MWPIEKFYSPSRHPTCCMQAFSTAFLVLLAISSGFAQSFKGFDKNEYPGDEALRELSKTFAWSGYWLNAPPGMKSNPWQGKREVLSHAGFRFALLFNGRLDAELKQTDPAVMGRSDGNAAVRAARAEGFSAGSIVFLDMEEGGRLLPEQKTYLFSWTDALSASDFTPGVYCSSIAVPDGAGKTISTAEDIGQSEGVRHIHLWVAQDTCPPSPGCSTGMKLTPDRSGTQNADIWQYAQSPRRAQFTASCVQTYAPDSRCYAPGTQIFVDLNTSKLESPSAPNRRNASARHAKRTP